MIQLIWGKEGSCKTTFGLSNPKPLFHMELDIGGFERAAWRLPKELRVKQCEPKENIRGLDWSQWDIVTKPYYPPLSLDKLVGTEKVSYANAVTVRFPRKVVGYRELWEELIVDYVTVCQAPVVKTIMPDSATTLWFTCHTAHLQDKQEIQLHSGRGITENHPDFREKLQAVEFPNDKMYSFLATAKSFGKNLIMTHYPTDEYADKLDERGRKESYKTGNLLPDGFKHEKEKVDIVIWTYIARTDKGLVPSARVGEKCGVPGLGVTACGLEIIPPSYDGLMELRNTLAGG